MLIAALSTLISSIALAGVAVSLYLQARQLRSAQLDSTASSQRELMKFALDHAAIYCRVVGLSDPDELAEQVVLNWQLYHIRTSFMNDALSERWLRGSVKLLFSTDFARKWWEETAGETYKDAASRREKEFFTIVEEEFQRQKLVPEPSGAKVSPPGRPA